MNRSPIFPSPEVLEAFGARGVPETLGGGQGLSVRAGEVVLKPAEDSEETRWLAEFYLALKPDGFRLPRPRRAHDGAFVFQSWQAWDYLEGKHEGGRWEEVLEVCERFHRALAGLPKPQYFPRRAQNPWVVADQVAWGEKEIAHYPQIAPLVGQLRAALEPLTAHDQLIHGDFGGNVLFAEGLPPAVIDFSPYWRPAPFAAGVVVADAIIWEGADFSLIQAGTHLEHFRQHLLRAELRRVIELETLYQQYGWNVLTEIEAHKPLIARICRR